jgi:hypothetical protein
MAEKRSTRLWRMATPLKRAWLEFAATGDRAAYEALPSATTAIAAESRSPDLGWLGRIGSAIATGHSAGMKKRSAESKLRDELVRRIDAGELEALGYRREPTRSGAPVTIDNPDFTKYPPDWEKESIEIRDEVYVDVRIIHSSIRAASVAKRGPKKGSADKIREAINRLCENPELKFCDMSRGEATQKVIELLKADGINTDRQGVGLSDGNIAKLIVKRCGKREL